jgi:hypothetical protein
MLKLLGVTGKLPAAGLPARMLRGRNELREPVSIKVWVAPLVGEAPRNALGRAQKRSSHRVRCECPGCGVELSAGRLFQHVCPPKHAPSYACDCSDCRLTRASSSNPHGYVSRKECG